MRLPDFLNFDPLNKLRKEMGIDGFIEWNPNIKWKDINPEDWKNLHIQGLEVPLEEIKTQSDGTLEYRGRKVVVYIRDQISYHRSSLENSTDPQYKFHLAWCETLRTMTLKGKYKSRYVVSRRTDGIFVVNLFQSSQLINKNLELKMKVCKNCLGRIDYKGYRDNREKTYNEFSIKEYFKIYDSQISVLPPHTVNTAPLNTYSRNFGEISYNFKKMKGWICEICKQNFSSRKPLLHTHHKNSDKSDNRPENLMALCKDCHKEQPDHGHMR